MEKLAKRNSFDFLKRQIRAQILNFKDLKRVCLFPPVLDSTVWTTFGLDSGELSVWRTFGLENVRSGERAQESLLSDKEMRRTKRTSMSKKTVWENGSRKTLSKTFWSEKDDFSCSTELN